MIAPTDPRHGSRYGYREGCRDDCCKRAQMRYMKVYRMGRRSRLIDATGTQRRIRALLALGWTHRDLGEHLGRSKKYTHEMLYSIQVRADIAALIDAMYRELCMTVPTGRYVRRNRMYAARMGWLPPLAWEDIDNPAEIPAGTYQAERRRDEIDEAVVARVLDGDNLPTTVAEKREIVRRWRAAGHPLNELERRTGWQVNRYGKGRAA